MVRTPSRVAGTLLGLALAALVPGAGCDPAGPGIRILSPAHGAFVTGSGSTAYVTGTLTGIAPASAEVRIFPNVIQVHPTNGSFTNGVVATLNANGTFSATVPIDRPQVENTLIAHVAYAPAGSSLRTRVLRDAVVIHAVASTAHQGPGRDDAAAIRMTNSGFTLFNGQVTQSFQAQVPAIQQGLIAAIAQDPDFNDQNTETHIYGMTVGSVGAATRSNVGHVDVDVEVSGLHIWGLYRFKTGFWNNCHFDIYVGDLDVQTDHSLIPGAGSPHVLPAQIDVHQTGVHASAQAMNVSFGGICQLASPFGALLFRPKLENAVESNLADPDGVWSAQDALIAEQLELALANIRIAPAVGTALGMDLQPEMTTVDEDWVGTTAASGLYPIATSNLCGPGGLFPEACPSLGADTVLTATPLPANWDQTVPPPIAQPYDLAFGLSPDALNPLFKAVAESGRLSARVTHMIACERGTSSQRLGGDDDEPIGNHGSQLDLGCLVDYEQLACDLVGLPCDTRLQIRAYPSSPPVVRAGAGPFATQLPLVMHGLRIEVWTDPAAQGLPAGPAMLWRFLTSFEAGADLVVRNPVNGPSTLGLDIFLCDPNGPSPCTPDLEVNTIVSNVPNSDVTPFLVDKVLLGSAEGLIGNTLSTALDAAVAEYPLPSFLNHQLQGVATMNFGGYASAFFRLVP